MAKFNPNTVLGILHGKLGNLVFVPTDDGRVIVKHRPVRTKPFSAAQRANHERFAKAAAYLKGVKHDPELRAFYAAQGRLHRRRACELAQADFWHAPVIQDVDLGASAGKAGQPIRIRATDQVGVSAVTVSLASLDGTVLEEGPAVAQADADLWVYLGQTELTPGQAIAVRVTVRDRPGNSVSKTVHHALIALPQGAG